MRVLLVSQYYFPEPVEKVSDLARGLKALGHHVEVLTGYPCYPRGEIYPGYRQRPWSVEEIDGVPVTRVAQLPDHSSSAFRRILYYVSFMLSAAFVGAIRRFRPDAVLVYQSALPAGIAAWFLARVSGARLVLDVVDLWPESVTSSGMMKSRLVEKSIRSVVRWLYARAARINVVTEGFRSNLLRMGVPERKLSLIHNWMPAATYQAVPCDERVATRERLAGRFNVMYAGNIGPVQALDTVIEAARLLRDVPDVQFVLVGDGTQSAELEARAREQELDNVRFLGRRDPREMPALYACADVLLVHLKPDALTELSIPSKTFAYMAIGKPILMAIRGDGARLVEQEQVGMTIEPCDPAAMAAAVRSLRMRPASELDAIGRRASEVYRAKYSGDVQIGRFSDLLTAAVAER